MRDRAGEIAECKPHDTRANKPLLTGRNQSAFPGFRCRPILHKSPVCGNDHSFASTSKEETGPAEVEVHAYPGSKAHLHVQLDSAVPVMPDAGTFRRIQA
jgi:hypothetical protein